MSEAKNVGTMALPQSAGSSYLRNHLGVFWFGLATEVTSVRSFMPKRTALRHHTGRTDDDC
jgi:hypothetical protein